MSSQTENIFASGKIFVSRYTAGNGVTGDCSYDYNGMAPSVGVTGYETLTPNSQEEVSCDWWTAGHVTLTRISDWRR